MIYFNKAVLFYIDFNIIKKKEFDIMTYYNLKTKLKGLLLDKPFLSTVIKSIIFLSKILLSAEMKYWLTKLEIADFV